MTRRNIPGTSIPDLNFRGTAPSRSPLSSLPPGHPLVSPPPPPPGNPFYVNPYGEEVGELLPWEQNAALAIVTELMQAFSSTTMTQDAVRKLEGEAKERFAEELGLVVTLDWDANSPEPDGIPSSDRVWFSPNLVIEARIHKHTVDHDEVARAVVSGEADGITGYIRSDGTRSEEPRRKHIT